MSVTASAEATGLRVCALVRPDVLGASHVRLVANLLGGSENMVIALTPEEAFVLAEEIFFAVARCQKAKPDGAGA